jgi:hypothetical protein
MSLPATDEFGQLWTDALEKYKKQTDVDLLKEEIAQQIGACNSADDVVHVLDHEIHAFKEFRAEDSRWGKLRNQVLKPLIDVVLRINDVAAETASSLVSGPPNNYLLSFSLNLTVVCPWRKSRSSRLRRFTSGTLQLQYHLARRLTTLGLLRRLRRASASVMTLFWSSSRSSTAILTVSVSASVNQRPWAKHRGRLPLPYLWNYSTSSPSQ